MMKGNWNEQQHIICGKLLAVYYLLQRPGGSPEYNLSNQFPLNQEIKIDKVRSALIMTETV